MSKRWKRVGKTLRRWDGAVLICLERPSYNDPSYFRVWVLRRGIWFTSSRYVRPRLKEAVALSEFMPERVCSTGEGEG